MGFLVNNISQLKHLIVVSQTMVGHVDLVQRVYYLNSKGEKMPIERFYNWLKESEDIFASNFIVENEKYYWKIISSIEFNDIIHEDLTDWLLIYSEKQDFKAIAKISYGPMNLIGETREFRIPTLWILRSNITSIQINEVPVLVSSPQYFLSPLHRIDYDLKQLMTKLRDTKTKIIRIDVQGFNNFISPSSTFHL